MQAWLQVSHPRANLSKVRLLPQTLVGRSPECHLRIATPLVSRRHCRFTLQSDGVYIEDLASANGTLLDGIRLPVLTPTYVRPDAMVDIGPARFQVVYATLEIDDLPGHSSREAADTVVPGPWLIGSGQGAEDGTIEIPQPEVATVSGKPAADNAGKPAARGSFFGALFGRSKTRKPGSGADTMSKPLAPSPPDAAPSAQQVEGTDAVHEPETSADPSQSETSSSGTGDQSLQDFLNKLG